MHLIELIIKRNLSKDYYLILVIVIIMFNLSIKDQTKIS